jgi:hypothetical protein
VLFFPFLWIKIARKFAQTSKLRDIGFLPTLKDDCYLYVCRIERVTQAPISPNRSRMSLHRIVDER